MSGILVGGHNKFISCDGCTDRSVIPNCHGSCEGYIFRQKKRQEIADRQKKDGDYLNFKKSVVYISKKRAGMK